MARNTRKFGIALVVLLLAAGAGAFAPFSGWDLSALRGGVGAVVPPAATGPAKPAPEEPASGDPAAPSAEDPTGGDDAAGDPAAAGEGGQQLTLSGSVEGTITLAGEATCTTQPDNSFAWRLVGALNRAPVTISFNTNNYRGPSSYNATSISDENGGFLALEVGQSPTTTSYGTNGASQGTFTVDDQTSGSVDADVTDANSGREVHLSGSWHCTT